MSEEKDNNIKVIQYNDGILFRPKNKRISILKLENDESVTIFFTRLLKLETQEDKDKYIAIDDTMGRKLIHRPHSKYCIWLNQLTLSMESFSCLHEGFEMINNITTYVWKEENNPKNN